MSETLEPRTVDKPFVRRWLLTTLALMGRAPLRFGLLILVLGLLDSAVDALFAGFTMSERWSNALAVAVLPFFWLLVAAVARGADNPMEAREALVRAFRSETVKHLGAFGLTYATAYLLLHWYWDKPVATHPHPGSGTGAGADYLSTPGHFIDSIAVYVGFYSILRGLCYFPLMAWVPGVGAYALRLARRANELNGTIFIDFLIVVLVLPAAWLAEALPAFGMTNAAFVVFMGTLNYIVYRDIFERRTNNLPVTKPVSENPVIVSRVVPVTPTGP